LLTSKNIRFVSLEKFVLLIHNITQHADAHARQRKRTCSSSFIHFRGVFSITKYHLQSFSQAFIITA